MDPQSSFADPDPAVFFNADPDPAAFLMRIRIQLQKRGKKFHIKFSVFEKSSTNTKKIAQK